MYNNTYIKTFEFLTHFWICDDKKCCTLYDRYRSTDNTTLLYTRYIAIVIIAYCVIK